MTGKRLSGSTLERRKKMTGKSQQTFVLLGMLLSIGLALILPGQASAHCDTLDGPVVADARDALAKEDVTSVLKWVKVDDEKEIRAAFAQTLAVRKLTPDARNLSDRYFFETLVRVHRAGEGAPYTGLKSAGTVEPLVAKADLALEQGSVDRLAKGIAAHTEEGIRQRFNHALETRKSAGQSVQDGRKYVEAYVTFVHYVEGIAQVVHGAPHPAKTVTPRAHPH
jgi:hypothetical protein